MLPPQAMHLLLLCIALVFAVGLEENVNFCLHADPLLLSDIERQQLLSSVAITPNTNCSIEARLLTDKEKESFVDTMCKDYGTHTHRDNYQYLKVRNGELTERGSYHDICKNTTNPLLAWIPYGMVQKFYAHELDPKDYVSYIAKATSVERARTELCHFRHADLINNIAENLFACIVMIFEDNFYGLDDNINVLVEIQPLAFEVRNVTYSTWRNVTNSYKTMLGHAKLKNPGRVKKPIYGSLNYSFVQKIKLNVSSISIDHSENLPILLEYSFTLFELDANGVGGVEVKEKAFFGRSMDAESEVKLAVIGQWAEQRKAFTAELHEYFGSGIRRLKQKIDHGDITSIKIDSTEPVFEALESINLAKASIFNRGNSFERLSMFEEGNGTDDIDTDWNDFDYLDRPSNHPYPGFYPWFVASCLVIALALVIVIYGIVRSNSKKNVEKQKYELTGM